MASPWGSVFAGIVRGEERARERKRQEAQDAEARELARLQREALIAAANERSQAPIRQQKLLGQRVSVLRRQPQFQGYSDDELMGIAGDENAYRSILLQSMTPKKKAVAFDAATGKPYVYDPDNPVFPEGFVGPHQKPDEKPAQQHVVDPVTGKVTFFDPKNPPTDLRVNPTPRGTGRPPSQRPPTEFQQKMGLVLPNAESAAERIRAYVTAHGSPPLRSLMGKLTLGQYGVTADEQQFRSAAETLLAAILRPETGAAVSDAEWDKYAKIFIPMPGDKPALIQQKLEEIDRRLKAMRSVMPGESPSGDPELLWAAQNPPKPGESFEAYHQRYLQSTRGTP